MSFLGYFGFASIIIIALQTLFWIYQNFFPHKFHPEKYGPGTWAVITGSSDGIGKGFVNVLAQYGFKICLIARNPEKLQTVKEEILKASPKTEIKIVIADFKKSLEPGFYDDIANQLKNLDISILINNVGVGNTGFFHKIDDKKIDDVLLVNLFPQFYMTKKLIPQLLSRLSPSKNLKSAVINVSSINGIRAFPYVCMYSASKAFNDFMSRTLSIEYKNRVDFLSLRPGYVTSQMTYRKVGFDTISPEECAEGCLRDLGRKSWTFGHWKHEIVGTFTRSVVPEWLLMNAMKIVGPRVAKKIEMKEKIYQDSLKATAAAAGAK